ncbi:uncharacterized protein LOC129777930 [Toxorhynchites rutilus septentrionalis]|uniref:uncharacterized protein LOC129777930 n=1 Tax=Toxorhynchites rutilus septentrionalis TaxID=329112 RepID=UPI002479B6EB|nr:uncharacterized protein LOC129777930 [Toxorhynchites rutilus septentrionalis]
MKLMILMSLVVVGAAPFTGWLGGQNNVGGGLLGKVHQFSEKVYERKREFFMGINEKVSNMLWITTSTTTEMSKPKKDTQFDSEDRLSSTTSDDDEPYLAIYARSSFLSPDDLIERSPQTQFTSKDTPNVNKIE